MLIFKNTSNCVKTEKSPKYIQATSGIQSLFMLPDLNVYLIAQYKTIHNFKV